MTRFSTDAILALRRQIRNLRDMIRSAQEDTNAKATYVQELKKKLAAAEKRLFKN